MLNDMTEKIDEILFEYICACCGHEDHVNMNIGTVCKNCNWEYDPDEEGDDPYAFGPNGTNVSEYHSAWVRAGKPKGLPRWRWKDEVN